MNLIISSDGSYGVSLNGRIRNYSNIFDDNLLLNIFGRGVWTESSYLPSLGRIFLSYGIFGGCCLLLLYFLSLFKLKKYNKKLLLLFIVSFIGTNSLFNITSVLCFTLIYGLNGDEIYDM